MMAVEEPDEGLVARAVAGDRAGFAALVSRHYDMMFRVAWKWCGNRTDAEDIAQDVCVRLAKSIRSYSGQAQFSTWLYRVVLNAAHDHQRSRAAHGRKLDAWANEPTRPQIQPPDVYGEDNQDEAALALWNRVRQLPPKQRDAVLLVFGEGLSHGEAAKALNCAEGTVSSNIHDAKKRLKQMMTEGATV